MSAGRTSKTTLNNTGDVIYHVNKLKSYTIISIDTEKYFDKIQHPFLIKTLQRVSIEGNIPQPNESNILIVKKLNIFLPRSKT